MPKVDSICSALNLIRGTWEFFKGLESMVNQIKIPLQ